MGRHSQPSTKPAPANPVHHHTAEQPTRHLSVAAIALTLFLVGIITTGISWGWDIALIAAGFLGGAIAAYIYLYLTSKNRS